MWERLGWAWVMGSFGLVACGEASESPSASGGSAGASSVGGAKASGGAGAAGTPGSGGANAGSTSGGSSMSGGPAAPTAVPALECGAGEVVFEGTVGGVAIKERLQLTGPAAGYAGLGAFSGGISSVSLLDGSSVAGAHRLTGGVLAFPVGSARAGEIWCIDEGSLLADDNRPAGAFVGHLLGKCPGTAVASSLHACFDSAQGYCDEEGEADRRSLGGELAGKTIESPAVGLTSLSARAWAASTTLFDLMLFAATVPSVAAPAKLNGFVIANEGNPDVGAVYCIDDGEWAKYSDDLVLNANVASLKQVSYAGSCADGAPTESLNVCLGI